MLYTKADLHDCTTCSDDKKNQATPLDDGAELSSVAGHQPSKENGESLVGYPWYCGKKSRIEAERILSRIRLRDGTFLIRESDVRHGEYVIAVK